MEEIDRILVIDADGHVNEGDADIRAWLPEKIRRLAAIRINGYRGNGDTFSKDGSGPHAEGPVPYPCSAALGGF